MKLALTRIAFGVVLLALVVWAVFKVTSFNRAKEESKEEPSRVEIARDARIERAISVMASRHNAVANWEETLGALEILYSSQVENTLKGSGKPILFRGSVDDISERDDKPFVHFRSGPFFHIGNDSVVFIHIRFVLESNPNQVRVVLDEPRDSLREFAVIASVSSVQRSTDVTEESSRDFIATGRCLDLLSVRAHGPEEQR